MVCHSESTSSTFGIPERPRKTDSTLVKRYQKEVLMEAQIQKIRIFRKSFCKK